LKGADWSSAADSTNRRRSILSPTNSPDRIRVNSNVMQIVDIDTERKSVAIVIITVAAIPARPGTFTAHLDGRPIVTSRQPFLDAAQAIGRLFEVRR
jgi:hypothetical protein